MTAGQELAAALRRYFSLGTRTRRYRRDREGGRLDLHAEMADALMTAAQYPGYFTPRTEAALHPGFGAALSYRKHVRGFRISGTLAQQINGLSAWRFAGLLGDMVDAGVTCTGDGERFFSDLTLSS